VLLIPVVRRAFRQMPFALFGWSVQRKRSPAPPDPDAPSAFLGRAMEENDRAPRGFLIGRNWKPNSPNLAEICLNGAWMW